VLCWYLIFQHSYQTFLIFHSTFVWNSMAEDAVDAAIKTGKLKPSNGCVTDQLGIVGAYGWDRASFTVLAQNYVRMKQTNRKVIPGAMDTAVSKHLSHAYGSVAERVAAIAQVHIFGTVKPNKLFQSEVYVSLLSTVILLLRLISYHKIWYHSVSTDINIIINCSQLVLF
jgi:C-terminal domain of alpha-glycerophosphate oxidase